MRYRKQAMIVAAQPESTEAGAEILKAVRVAALIASSAERKLDMELLQLAAAERLAMRG